MAKKQSKPAAEVVESAPASNLTPTEARIEEFAEDLGRLLGTARAKAEGWIGQRAAITKHLEDIRDTASGLLSQLTGLVGRPAARRGRPPKGSVVGVYQPAPKSKRKRRKLSAEGRERIAAAQRARWAKQKAAKK